MTENIYVIDTSSIIDIFRIHPPEMYPYFWEKLNCYFDSLLKCGRMRILDYVYDEVIRDTSGTGDVSGDPASEWLSGKKSYIISVKNDFFTVKKAQEIVQRFPSSADIVKKPPAADPYLIAYVLIQRNQRLLDMQENNFIIVTQEIRNSKKISLEKLRLKKIIPELTKIRSICDVYEIDSMNYMDMFKAEKWQF